MNPDIELYADTLLLMIMTLASILLMQIDPQLPMLWGLMTFLMTFIKAT